MKIFYNGNYQEAVSIEELKSLKIRSLTLVSDIDLIVQVLDFFSREVLNLDIDLALKEEISDFCSKKEITNKLLSELGSANPFDIKKRSFKASEMESYYPLGTLLHVTSSNSEGLAFLALVEGLISGNSNIVKLSRRDSDVCFKLVESLLACDKQEVLKGKIVLLQNAPISIEQLISISDGVSCWGGDAALNNIRGLVPSSKRFITWGHKISFALIDLEGSLENKAQKLVQEIIKFDQQACSAPQVCYLLNASFEDIKEFSKYLDNSFREVIDLARVDLDIQEKAELTNFNQLLKLESLIENKIVKIGSEHKWRIYSEESSTFKPSPLNRTIWIKPLATGDIIDTFLGHRDYLQTVGVSLCDNNIDIIQSLLQAGATRVRELGRMQESYSGEPHDGEYALRRFVKKISVDVDILEKNFRLNEKVFKEQKIDKSLPVMGKKEFQEMKTDSALSHLFFRSGGSSGKSSISTFSYNSYHIQMMAAAEGLISSGLDPKVDRCANLFFGGGLYGGFISFFTILEMMEAIQFPIAAYENKEFVADTILENNIDTLLGMPSYLIDLFNEQGDILKKSSVKKIFFGGEHFPEAKRNWLRSKFGIEVIRSASYGSVDAGPLGFQCECCVGSEHHLNETIQQLEVLNIEDNSEAAVGEVGRLVFTSKARESISIKRYDLGDLGRIIPGYCDCGRKNLKFELLGRHGDIFRAGGTFFNYTKIQRILAEDFGHEDVFQIIINNKSGKDSIELHIDSQSIKEEDLIEKYRDLSEAVLLEKTVSFSIFNSTPDKFLHTENSGKTLRVVDQRVF